MPRWEARAARVIDGDARELCRGDDSAPQPHAARPPRNATRHVDDDDDDIDDDDGEGVASKAAAREARAEAVLAVAAGFIADDSEPRSPGVRL